MAEEHIMRLMDGRCSFSQSSALYCPSAWILPLLWRQRSEGTASLICDRAALILTGSGYWTYPFAYHWQAWVFWIRREAFDTSRAAVLTSTQPLAYLIGGTGLQLRTIVKYLLWIVCVAANLSFPALVTC